MASSFALQRHRDVLHFTQQVSRAVISYRTHATAAATASSHRLPTISSSIPATRLSSADKTLDTEVHSHASKEYGLGERAQRGPAVATPQPPPRAEVTPPVHQFPSLAGLLNPTAATLGPLLSDLRAAHLAAPSSTPAALIASLRSRNTFLTQFSQLKAGFPPPPPPPPHDRGWREKLVNALLVQAMLLGAGGLGLLRNGKRGKGVLGEIEGEIDREDGVGSKGEQEGARVKLTRSCMDDGEGVMSLNLLIASFVWRPSLPWTVASEATKSQVAGSAPTPSQILSLVKLFNTTNATFLPTSSTLSLASPLIPDRFTLLTLLSYLHLSGTSFKVRFPILLWIWREFSRLSLSSTNPNLRSPEVIAIDRLILSTILDLLLNTVKRLRRLEQAATSIAFELVDGVANFISARAGAEDGFCLRAGEGAVVTEESLLKDLLQVATLLGHFPVLDRLLDGNCLSTRPFCHSAAAPPRSTKLTPQLRLEASLGLLISLWTRRSFDPDNLEKGAPPVWAAQVSMSKRAKRIETGYKDQCENLVNARIVVHRIVRSVLVNVKDCIKARVTVDWKSVHRAESFVLAMLRHKSWGVDVPLEELLTELVCLGLNHHGTSFSTRRSSDDNPDFFTLLIIFLVDSRHPRLASNVFDALPTQVRLPTDYDALIATHHLPTSKSTWDSLVHRSTFQITKHSLRQRLRSHADSMNNDLVGAYGTLNEAAFRGIEAGLLEYNLVLKIAVEVGSDMELTRFLRKMRAYLKKQGVSTSDATTSNILLMREMASPKPFIKGQRVAIAGRRARLEGQVKRMHEAIGSQSDRGERTLATSTPTSTPPIRSKPLPPAPDNVTTSLLLKGLSHSSSTRDLIHLARHLLHIDLTESDPVSTYQSTKREYETHRRAKYLMLIKAMWHRDAFELRSKLLRGMREEERRIRPDAWVAPWYEGDKEREPLDS